jgi:phosphoesterase RecJ-like protein
MKRIIQQLNECQCALLASHAVPDGDAIGSLLALGCALTTMGKHVVMHNASPIPAVYRFLPMVERIATELPKGAHFDTAVMLDCGDLSRVGMEAERISRIPRVINIDHHLTNTRFGQLALVDPEACATAEIVYRIIGRLGVRIDGCMATALYTGILTDTGSFRFSNTNAAAFRICGEMVALGVDPYRVAQHVYGTYSLGRIKLLNLALDSIELRADGRISIMALTRQMMAETHTQPEDTDGLINYAKRIEQVRVAVLIQERLADQGEEAGSPAYHVSLRSVDVAALAAAFGGGGHASAAGFNTDGPPARIKAAVVRMAEPMLQGA